jgi:hypothetical protein
LIEMARPRNTHTAATGLSSIGFPQGRQAVTASFIDEPGILPVGFNTLQQVVPQRTATQHLPRGIKWRRTSYFVVFD